MLTQLISVNVPIKTKVHQKQEISKQQKILLL